MEGYANLITADTAAGPSNALWFDAPGRPWVPGSVDPREAYGVGDDFNQGGLITSPTTEAALVGIPYSGFGSSGSTITFADTPGGALVCTEATDNEAVYAYTKTKPFQISSLLGDFWFEARVKVSAITDNQIGFVCGLSDGTAVTVTVPLDGSNPPVLAGCNFVGFRGPEEDAGSVISTYIADGVTPVAVQSAVHQFVADTYVKLGMKFMQKDPLNSGNPTLSFYVNGVRQTSHKTIPNATGTDFPADVRLGFLFGHKLGASTSSLTTCDWWYGLQKRVS